RTATPAAPSGNERAISRANKKPLAPWRTASGIYACPSTLLPGSGTKRAPGATVRESIVTEVKTASPGPLAKVPPVAAQTSCAVKLTGIACQLYPGSNDPARRELLPLSALTRRVNCGYSLPRENADRLPAGGTLSAAGRGSGRRLPRAFGRHTPQRIRPGVSTPPRGQQRGYRVGRGRPHLPGR